MGAETQCFRLLAPVAQGIEHRIPNPGAAGSIPARCTTQTPQPSRVAAFAFCGN